MYWLRVGQKFYNLHRIVKIDYAIENDKLMVHIYSDLHGEPLKLIDEDAALFLDTISKADGCWAFRDPEEVSQTIQGYLNKLLSPSENSDEFNELVDEPEVE